LISGFVAGAVKGANPGLVVCVALICVTFLAWAPSPMLVQIPEDMRLEFHEELHKDMNSEFDTESENRPRTVVREEPVKGRYSGIVLLIVSCLSTALTLSYLFSRKKFSSSGKRDGKRKMNREKKT